MTIFNLDTLEKVGEIAGVGGNGTAVDPNSTHGFTSDHPKVSMFDTKTLTLIKSIDVGAARPDGILFDAFNDRVYVFSHPTKDATIIDSKDGTVLGTIDLGGVPEQGVADGKGMLYVVMQDAVGSVTAVDVKTMKATEHYSGCMHWSFQAQGGVRSAISIGRVNGQGAAQYAAYFGDLKANVYAVDAMTGRLLWRVSADDHPLAHITGAPQLYNDSLYVPVASGEEVAGATSTYPCCTFRGSVVALEAATGRQIWKTYTISEEPRPTRKTSTGTQIWGPSGGGVWNSPTIDPKRHALYIGTGDAYSEPAAKGTDAIMALDIDTGKLLWSVQDTEEDAWVVGCDPQKLPENCPERLGPDYDFGSSPILKTLLSRRDVLVAGQKSGIVWAHDPDQNGAVVWKRDVTRSKPAAEGEIVWGGAADSQSAYFGLNSGGLVSIQLVTGERQWFTPLEPASGMEKHRGHSGALTAIPGVVFSAGWDGVLRALAAATGKVIWEYATVREYKTVNGVPAKGGSMGAPGPTVADGMLFVGSGYPGVQNGAPGNVLLAFSVR